MIPFLDHIDARRKHVIETVTYNSTGQKLDIWAPPEPASNAPVMFFVPGGGWLIGDRRGQGYQLMSHLVDQGWICVAVDYRTAPVHRWPTPFEDVVAAWMWAQDNLQEYGAGDFMAIAGASAGAHMASLLALASGHDAPDALVSLYGVYSWVDKSWDHWLINQFVKTVVASGDKKTLRAASPILRVHRDAPPTLIVHGDKDFVTPFSGAQKFWAALDDASNNSAWLYRIAGGHHGFDLVNSGQANVAIALIDDFLTNEYVEWGMAS